MIWDELKRINKDLDEKVFHNLFQADDINKDLENLKTKNVKFSSDYEKIKQAIEAMIKQKLDTEKDIIESIMRATMKENDYIPAESLATPKVPFKNIEKQFPAIE
jgi:lantibiotic modifying enzyme